MFIYSCCQVQVKGASGPGYLMESFGEQSVFLHAMSQYVRAASLDQIIIVCPDTDVAYFKQEINHLALSEDSKKVTVTGISLKEIILLIQKDPD